MPTKRPYKADFPSANDIIAELEGQYGDDSDLALGALQLLELRALNGSLSRIHTLLNQGGVVVKTEEKA